MSKKTGGAKKFGFKDFFVIVLFLSIAAVSIEMFRRDLLQTFRLQNVEPVGTVVVKKNTVQRRLGDRVVWDRLTNESPVYIGDLVRIADLSAASLHIGATDLELGENTLIRILLSPDGEGIQIILSEGSLSLTTNDDSVPITVDINGRQIVTGPGTSLSAAISDDGQMSFQVVGESVRFIEPSGESREVASGNMVFMEADGTEVNKSAVAMYLPPTNVRSLRNIDEPLPVNFSWNRINIEPDAPLRLEIASDRNFMRITDTFDDLNNSALVRLNSGLWYWRILHEGIELSTGNLTIADGTGPQLYSPAANSIFRYRDELPVVHFQWQEIEEAVSYVLEASTTSDFSNIQIRRQSSTSSLTDSGLTSGLWFWRVMPVFPPVFSGYAAYSTASFFRIEQSAPEIQVQEAADLSLWLAAEAPSYEIPPGVPADIVPVSLIEMAPPPPPPPPPPAPPPAPVPPAPPVLLAAPQGMRPVNRSTFDHAQLRNQRTIVFNWSAVQGANAYIFSLYHQTPAGRRQIVRATVNRGTSYTVDNFRLLDRGTFVWQVEPIVLGRGNAIDRRGRVAENTFVIDFQSPRPVQIEDTGILYGN